MESFMTQFSTQKAFSTSTYRGDKVNIHIHCYWLQYALCCKSKCTGARLTSTEKKVREGM